MEMIPCTGCGLPRNPDDAESPCAVCGTRCTEKAILLESTKPPFTKEEPLFTNGEPLFSNDEPLFANTESVTVELAPAPPSREPGTVQNRLVLSSFIVIFLGVLTAMMWEPWAEAEPPLDTVAVPPPAVSIRDNPLSPVAAIPPRGPELAPAPRLFIPSVTLLPVPTPIEIAPPPRVWVSPEGVAILRFDRPGETIEIPRIGERNHLRLIGTAKKLIVGGVENGAVFDASRFRVKDVSFTGKIDDGSTVNLWSEGGTVSFRQKVSGGSELTVDAGTGYVSFSNATAGKAEGSKIDEGSKVTIRAKTVSMIGTITGAETRVDVTLATGGTLRFKEMTDSAKLHYRQADPTADPPRITPGTVKNGAECRKVQ